MEISISVNGNNIQGRSPGTDPWVMYNLMIEGDAQLTTTLRTKSPGNDSKNLNLDPNTANTRSLSHNQTRRPLSRCELPSCLQFSQGRSTKIFSNLPTFSMERVGSGNCYFTKQLPIAERRHIAVPSYYRCSQKSKQGFLKRE